MKKTVLALLVAVVLVVTAVAATFPEGILYTPMVHVRNGYVRIGDAKPDITLANDALYVEGEAEFDSTVRFDAGFAHIRASREVEITSPSTTFAVMPTDDLIVLTSDANVTGVTVTGGALNQVVTLITGSGSNTITFNDGANMVLGSNVTMKEGDGDVLTLMCTSADGDKWVRLSSADN